MKIRYIFLVAALFVALSVKGQENTAFGENRTDRNPASLSMASAGLSRVDNASWGALYNPSTMVFSPESFGINLAARNWAPEYDGAKSGVVAAAYNAGRFSVALGGAYSIGKEYDVLNSNGSHIGSFAPSGMQAALGLGFRIMDNLSIGANVKYNTKTIAESYSYSAISTNLLLSYNSGDFGVSAGVMELGTKVEGKGGNSYSLPTSLVLAADYSLGFLDFVLDLDYYLSGGFSAALGAEYNFNEMLFIRGGYRMASGTVPVPSFASLGLGLQFNGIELNAAYLLASETLAGSLGFGLSYSF